MSNTTQTDTACPGSIIDQREGFPRLRARYAGMTDPTLTAEYRHLLRGTFDRVFGNIARIHFAVLCDEMRRRGWVV